MRQHNKFHTTVDFITIKDKQFHDSNGDIMDWLFKNVGRTAVFAWGDGNPGNWDLVHNYSEDGRKIIYTYSFKDPKDAVFFALKWR